MAFACRNETASDPGDLARWQTLNRGSLKNVLPANGVAASAFEGQAVQPGLSTEANRLAIPVAARVRAVGEEASETPTWHPAASRPESLPFQGAIPRCPSAWPRPGS